MFATDSQSEAITVSIIEALVCGRPFVGLQSAWWEEFAAEMHCGVVASGGAEGIAAAIQQLAAPSEMRTQ